MRFICTIPPSVPGNLITIVEILCMLLREEIICLVTLDHFTWTLWSIIIRTFVEWCMLWSPVYTLHRYCGSHIMVQTTIKTWLVVLPFLQSVFLRSVKLFAWHTHLIFPDVLFPRHFPTRIQYSNHACMLHAQHITVSLILLYWQFTVICKSHRFACYVI